MAQNWSWFCSQYCLESGRGGQILVELSSLIDSFSGNASLPLLVSRCLYFVWTNALQNDGGYSTSRL